MSDNPWFYTDANGHQLGPYPVQQIQHFAANGTITPQTLLWTEGLETWTAAGEVQGIFATSAPAPPPIDSTTPYTPAEQAQFGVAPPGGEFPIPFVKKSSFGLFLGSYILGLSLIIIGIFILVSVGSSIDSDQPYQDSDLSHIEDAGAPSIRGLEDEVQEKASPEKSEPIISESEAVKGILAMALIFIGGLCVTFGGIYAYVIVYRAWLAIQPGGAQSTPGKAVGFMFIPIFSLYWMFIAFHGWAKDWTRIRSSYSNLMAAPAVSPGNFLTGCILMLLVFPIGIFFFFSMISQMCAVTNYLASAFALSRTQSSGLTGTKFY